MDRSVLSILLLAICVVAVQGLNVAPSSAWTIEYVKTVYHPEAPVPFTSFHYRVTANTEGVDHIILKPAGGCHDLSLTNTHTFSWDASEKGFMSIGKHHHTQGQTQDYVIEIAGEFGVNAGGFTARIQSGADYFDYTNLVGPICGTDADSYLIADTCDHNIVPLSLSFQQPADTCVKSDVDVNAQFPQDAYTNQGYNFLSQTPRQSLGCDGSFSFVRTYVKSATANPNVANGYLACDQTVTFRDNARPQYTWDTHAPQAYLELRCGQTFEQPQLLGYVDNCDGAVTLPIAPCNETTLGSCPNRYDTTFTWTIEDSCGNSLCYTQVVKRFDDVPPVLTGVPADHTEECSGPSPVPDWPTVTATDDCQGCSPAVLRDQDSDIWLMGCDNTYVLTRTWNSTDCCGNFVEAQALHIVKDTTAPILTQVTPGDNSRNSECSDVFGPLTFSAFDTCADKEFSVQNTSSSTPLTNTKLPLCPQNRMVTYTYTSVDNCGNVATAHSYEIITDTVAPVIDLGTVPTGYGQSIQAQCSDVPAMADVKASDACSEVHVVKNETKVGTDCTNDYILNRTYTFSDDCGNSVFYYYLVHVVDLVPVFLNETTLPHPPPIQCASDAYLSTSGDLNAIQSLPCTSADKDAECSCDQFFTVDYEALPVDSSNHCNQVQTRTYTSVDCSGNRQPYTVTVLINDTTAPQMTPLEDISVYCTTEVAPASITATDNCAGSFPVSESPRGQPQPNGCVGKFNVTRTWTTTDSCGNPTTVHSNIAYYDNQPPLFSNPPTDTSALCHDVPVKIDLGAEDGCHGPAQVNNTIPIVRTNGDCLNNYTLTYTWSTWDDCGNSAEHVQVVTVYDNVAPVVTVDADITVTCDKIPPPGGACATDNCKNLTIKFTEQVLPNNPCDADTKVVKVIVRTWTATDACGNVGSASQRITVIDDMVPVIGSPLTSYQERSCDSIGTVNPGPAQDNCSGTLQPHVYSFIDQSVDSRQCANNYTRLYPISYTDNCGNVAWNNVTLFIYDVQKPVFRPYSPPAEGQCSEPSHSTPLADDSCSLSNVVVTQTNRRPMPACPYMGTVEYTYSAADECNNVEYLSFNVTYSDRTAPQFNVIPAARVEFECAPDTPLLLNATDNCGSPFTNIAPVNVNQQNGSCAYQYQFTRVWTVADECGNQRTTEQLVVINDHTAPVLSFTEFPNGLPEYVENECVPTAIPSACATDSCSGVYINYTTSDSTHVCANSYNVTRQWIAYDACGNSATKTQTVVVFDHHAPVFSTPLPDFANTYVDCVHPTLVTPDVSDNCNGAVQLDNLTHIANYKCDWNYDLVVAWRATDDCGNVAWWNYTVYVRDEHAPSVSRTFPNIDKRTCNDSSIPYEPNPVAFCAAFGSVAQTTKTKDETILADASCPYSFVRILEWKVFDECGNFKIVSQNISGYEPQPAAEAYFPDVSQHVFVDNCATPPTPPTFDIKDLCGHSLTYTVSEPDESIHDSPCSNHYTKTWTYSVTDLCGYSDTFTYTQEFRDIASPVVSATPNTSLWLDAAACVPHPPTPAVVDPCNNAQVYMDSVVTSFTCETIKTVQYTVTANDTCGNKATPLVFVHVYSDTRSLHWQEEGNLPTSVTTQQCDYAFTFPTLHVLAPCGDVIPVTPVNTWTNGSCVHDKSVVSVWTYIDSCGRTLSWTRTQTTQPPNKPTLVLPTDFKRQITVQCGFEPCPPTVNATSPCSNVSIAFTSSKIVHNDNCCNYTIVRTWTAIDSCGQTDEVIQTVNVIDFTPPVLIVPPLNDTECDKDHPYVPDFSGVKAYKPALATAFCAQSSTLADRCSLGQTEGSQLQVPAHFPGFNFQVNPTLQASTVIKYVTGDASVELSYIDASTQAHYTVQIELTDAVTYAQMKNLVSFEPSVSGLTAFCLDDLDSIVDQTQWTYYMNVSGFIIDANQQVVATIVTDVTRPSYVGIGADNLNEVFSGVLNGLVKQGTNNPAPFDATVVLTPGQFTAGAPCYFDKAALPELDCPDVLVPRNWTNCTDTCAGVNTTCTYNFCVLDSFSGIEVCDHVTHRIVVTTPPTIEITGDFTTRTMQCNNSTLGPHSAVVKTKCFTDVPLPDTTTYNFTCPNAYTMTTVYQFTDACGLQATPRTRVITVVDNTAPTITIDVNKQTYYECAAPQPAAAVLTDNCRDSFPDGRIQVSGLNVTSGSKCLARYSTVFTYIAEDDCGNEQVATYTASADDTIAPTFDHVPNYGVYECGATIEVDGTTASDTCEGDLTDKIVRTERLTTANAKCPAQNTTTVTWTVEDSCDNSATVSRDITVQDTMAPTWTSSLPTDTTIDACSPPGPVTLYASDVCDGELSAVSQDTYVNQNGACDTYDIVRYWKVCDCAGHCIDHTQNIHMRDIVAPVLHFDEPLPTSTVVLDQPNSCNNVPAQIGATATDNCNTVTAHSNEYKTQDVADIVCQDYTLNRTYWVRDACGNSEFANYLVQVRDLTAPACDALPTFAETECLDKPWPEKPAPSCNDDCSGVIVTETSPTPSKECKGNVTRTWSWKVADHCGNFVTLSTSSKVYDAVPPVISGVPQTEITFECVLGKTFAPSYSVNCFDACESNAVECHKDVATTLNCPGTSNSTATFTAHDDCGNEAAAQTHTFKTVDTMKPNFKEQDNLPTDYTVSCEQLPLATAETLTCQDQCAGEWTAAYTEDTLPADSTCKYDYQVKRTWTCTDCSGNTRFHVQTITVQDITTPTFNMEPADETRLCTDDLQVPAVCAYDNCAGVNLTYSEVRTNLPSNPAGDVCARYTLNRTWTAVDACGHTNTTSYIITVDDELPPSCPATQDLSYGCDAFDATKEWIPQPECVDSNGCSALTYTRIPVADDVSNTCHRVRYFYWKVEDACGNFVWWNSSVTFTDTGAPSFTTVPVDYTAECDAIKLDDVAYTDSCSAVPTLVYTPTVTPTDRDTADLCRNYTITRQWHIVDACGNFNDASQVITVQDTTVPVWTSALPQNHTILCNETYEYTPPTASDNCGNVDVTVQNRTVPTDVCRNFHIIEYTWTATDRCGNSISTQAYLTIMDNVQPIISGFPEADKIVETSCDHVSEVPLPQVCCSDNCGGLRLNYSETRVGSDCNYNLTRTWICVDACGNFDSKEQLIIVTDTSKPVFQEPLPVDAHYECTDVSQFNFDVNSVNVTAIDNCQDVTITRTQQQVQTGGCAANYTVMRSFMASDNCGNNVTIYQNVTVADSQPPTLESTFECLNTFGLITGSKRFLDVSESGNFFTFSDACGHATLEILGCCSDQDSLFQETCNVLSANASERFTTDCHYDNASDTLTVSSRLDTTSAGHELGRMYTVYARATDECGNSVEGTRQILVPFPNAPSTELRGLNSSIVCEDVSVYCPSVGCTCQTVDHYCVGGESASAVTVTYNFSSDNYNDGGAMFTQITLTLADNAPVPSRISVGLDLTQFEFIDAQPSFRERFFLGTAPGSLLNGVHWNTPILDNTRTFTIVLGTLGRQVTPGYLNIQLGGLQSGQDDEILTSCSAVTRTTQYTAPLSATPSTASPYNFIPGKVVLSDLYSLALPNYVPFGDMNIPLAGIPVTIVCNEQSANPDYRTIFTDANGQYKLNIPAGTAYSQCSMFVSFGGSLNAYEGSSVRTSASFIVRTTRNPSRPYSQFSATVPAQNDYVFRLLLDDTFIPDYAIPNDVYEFRGNSYPVSFWQHSKKELAYSNIEYGHWTVSRASEFTAGCSGTEALFADLESAAMNHGIGRGFFDPYRQVQRWFLKFANYALCQNTYASDSVRKAQAVSFAKRFLFSINSATDLHPDDRVKFSA